MKKSSLLILLASAFLAAGPAFASQKAFKVPVSANQVADPGLRSAGVDKVFLATSTNAMLATDSAGNTITNGFIYYIVRGSTDTMPAGGIFLEMRDSATAVTTGARLTPRITAREIGTGKYPAMQVLEFDPPIPFQSGLSLNIGAGDGATATAPTLGGNMEFGVGIRWKKQ